jgi:hypothetical protein
LCLAQRAEKRQLQAVGPQAQRRFVLGARVDAHAHRGDLAAAARHARMGQQLGITVGRRLAVEQRILHRHQHGIGQHHHAQQVVALQAAGRVEQHMRHAGWRAQDVARVDGPAGDLRCAGCEALFVALAQPRVR